MECAPKARVVKVNLAVPPLITPVPMVAAPSLNVIAPVGAPLVADLGVAVNVTDAPKLDGFNEDTTVVDDAALFTAWETAAEVLPVKFESPL